MRLLISLILLFSFSPYVGAQLNDYSRAELTYENALAKFNPGCQSGTVHYTISAGTLTINTAGPEIVPNGGAYCEWNPATSGNTLQTAAVKVPTKGTCEYSLWLNIATDSTYTMHVYDGTNFLVEKEIGVAGERLESVQFPCPISGTVRGYIRSNATGDANLKFDNSRLGRSTIFSATPLISEWVNYTPIVNNLGTGALSYNVGMWRQVGDSVQVRIKATKDTNNGSGTNAVTWSVPSVCTINTSKLPATTQQRVGTATDHAYGFTGSVQYLTSTTVYLYAMTEGTGQWNGSSFLANKQVSLDFTVPCVGWQATVPVIATPQGWWASGYIAGASVSLGTSAVSSYQEITNGSLTLTPDSGSAPIGITCSSTNAAASPSTGTTTCSAGNESLGIAVNIPRSGRYEICGQFGHNVASSAGDAGINVAFEWVNTATNSQTIVARMGPRTTSGHYNNSTSGQSKFGNVMACGQATLYAGLQAFRLFYEQSIPGANGPSTNVINIDADPNIGDRAMRVTLRPIVGEEQVVLANSVRTLDSPSAVINTIATPTTTYTATLNEDTIFATMSGGAWSLGLPPAATSRGKHYKIVIASGGNLLTIDPNASETICGYSTIAMRGQGDSITIASNGSGWMALDGGCFRTIHAAVTGANCTSSPCSLTYNTVGTSITRSTTGTYAFNFNGTLRSSVTPTCGCGSNLGSFSGGVCFGGNTTGTEHPMFFRNTADSLFDNRPMVTCIGHR